MESHNLERASQYLNNLLLARGLLINGKPIDFARPDRHGSNTATTMSQVINLVHDLVLRRDQDTEQRETLAMHIRQARASESQRVLDLQRLQDKNAELARAAAAAEAQERTLQANMRKAEAQAKELKDHLLRMKSTLDQVRAKCISDVRKRDTELDKLKAHMASMQRGKKESSGMKINTINWEPEVEGRERRNGQDVDSSAWSLEQESNDFLAALVNEASTENVSLRRIITDTMEILQDLTGIQQQQHTSKEESHDEQEDGIGIPGQYRKSKRRAGKIQQQSQTQIESLTSCDNLAQHMTTILEHCQTILKDPSFVPIEEVQVRDEEIIKLRVGWEKMASRWKEAVTMMDNWRRQGTANREDLSKEDFSRLGFGKSVAMLPNGQPVFGEDDELSSILFENSKLEEEDGDQHSEHEDHDVHYPELPRHDKIDQLPHPRELSSRSDIPAVEAPSPKRRASPGRKAGPNLGKPIRPLQSADLNHLNLSPGRQSVVTSAKSSSRQGAGSGLGSSESAMELDKDEDVWLDENTTESRIPRKVIISPISQCKVVMLRYSQTKRQEPVLSTAEKLAAVEADALEAQQVVTLHAGSGKKRKYGANGVKTRKAARRRSTLSPEELAELMGIE